MGSVSRRRDGDSLLPPPCGDAAISPATVTSDDWWRLDGPALGDGCGGSGGGGSGVHERRSSSKVALAGSPIDGPSGGVASPLLLAGGGVALACSPWDMTADEHSIMSCAGMGLGWADGHPGGGAGAADDVGLGVPADLPFLTLPPSSVAAAVAMGTPLSTLPPPPSRAAYGASKVDAYAMSAAAQPDAGSDVTLFPSPPPVDDVAAAGTVDGCRGGGGRVAKAADMSGFAALLEMDPSPLVGMTLPSAALSVTGTPVSMASVGAATPASAVTAPHLRPLQTPMPPPPPSALSTPEPLPEAIESKVRELEQLIFSDRSTAPPLSMHADAGALPPPPPPPPPSWRPSVPLTTRCPAAGHLTPKADGDMWLVSPRSSATTSAAASGAAAAAAAAAFPWTTPHSGTLVPVTHVESEDDALVVGVGNHDSDADDDRPLKRAKRPVPAPRARRARVGVAGGGTKKGGVAAAAAAAAARAAATHVAPPPGPPRGKRPAPPRLSPPTPSVGGRPAVRPSAAKARLVGAAARSAGAAAAAAAGRRKEIADGSTAAASSAGDTPAVSTADMTEEELKAMRAEKNRESARRSRAKIKEKVAAMEARLLDLSGENATLLALMESLMPEGRAPPSGDP